MGPFQVQSERLCLIIEARPANSSLHFYAPTSPLLSTVNIVELDEKGRITIPKRMRRILRGMKVLLINLGDRIEVVPIPEDPFKVLEGSFTTKRSFKELRREAEILAEREVENRGSHRE